MPRGGGWRPGARWAREEPSPAASAATIAALPVHRRPSPRELGRRSEAAQHPFRTARSDDGGAAGTATGVAAPASGPVPLVLALDTGRRQVVHAACPVAMALGLTPGTPIAQARALVPELEILPADLEAEATILDRMAVHAVRHWTPAAAVSGPDGLWLDVTGATHLFGGEERFCRRVHAFLGRLGLTARIALADTPGAAHALARHGRAQIVIVPPGRTVEAIAPLPVEALRFAPDALNACRRFGIGRISDLLPMPPGPLTRRLGQAAVERLDQAIGRVAEPIDPKVVEETPRVRRRLLEPIGTPEAIAQVITDVVADLVGLLRECGLGARSVDLALLRVDGTEQRISIGTAKATRDPRHISRLLVLRLEQIDPGMGIEEARLAAPRTEPLGAETLATMLAGDGATPDLSEMVDQIAGRVGRSATFRTAMAESDVPERGVRRVGPLEETLGWPAWRRPARLLRRPEPLHSVVALLPDHPPRRFGWRGSMHDVVAGDGPERIHGEWWVRDGEVWAVRDYYRVEDREGRRFWVFRRGDGVDSDTGDLTWWMHGAFG